MSFFKMKKDLTALKERAYKETDFSQNPGKFASLGGFFASIAASLRFVFTEKENIVFAVLQWCVIALCYYIWVQGLNWIPEEIWQNADQDSSENTAANIVLLVWSLACVGLAAFPLGVFTACISASCILRYQNRPSTFVDCLKIALSRCGAIWIFSWIDGWWTVKRILERLPKKNDRTPRSVKIIREATYQVWKMLTLGFIPALLFGRTFQDSCSDSLNLIKKRFLPLIKLRLGYSLICWIIGIGCYVGTIFFFICLDNMPAKNDIYSFYLLAGVPIIIALLFIMIIFRPLYIISACRIYVSYACDEGINARLPEKTSGFINILIIFMLLAGLIGVVLLFHQELGIDNYISTGLLN